VNQLHTKYKYVINYAVSGADPEGVSGHPDFRLWCPFEKNIFSIFMFLAEQALKLA